MPSNTGAIVAIVAAGLGILLLSNRTPAAGNYTCKYCGAPFDTIEAYQTHVQEVHPGKPIPIDITL